MNELKIFEHAQFGQMRTVLKDGEPWFVVVDVCRALGHSNVSMALDRLDEDERAKFNLGRQGETNIVNEPGLYALVLGSRKPEAHAFKRWITHEVLPAIRKTGGYVAGEARMAIGDMTMSEAVRTIRDCDPEVRPVIYSLLRRMGLYVPQAVPTRTEPPRELPTGKAAFTKWFREMYQKRGLTYRDLAEALNTSTVQIYRWGHGTFPQEANRRVILDFFGYDNKEGQL